MPSTLLVPARPVSNLPPIDLGTAGPGRYPTMAELRVFPHADLANFDPQGKAFERAMARSGASAGGAGTGGAASWYSANNKERERKTSQGPPVVQGRQRAAAPSSSSTSPPPPRRMNVRPVMPALLSRPGQQQQQQPMFASPPPPQQMQMQMQGQQQQQQQKQQHQFHAQQQQLQAQHQRQQPPARQAPMFIPLPQQAPAQPLQPQARLQRDASRPSALPPTTRPRGASRSPPTPTGSISGSPPRPPSAPPQNPNTNPSQNQGFEHHRGPEVIEQHGHRVLRKKHVPSPSLPANAIPAPPFQPASQFQPFGRFRRLSLGSRAASTPAPLQMPKGPAKQDIDASGSPQEYRSLGSASIHRYGEPESVRGRLRVVNAEVEESPSTAGLRPATASGWPGAGPAQRDADGDVLMNDEGRVEHAHSVEAFQRLAGIQVQPQPHAQAQLHPDSAYRRQSAEHERPSVLHIVRPEPTYPANNVPVARQAAPQQLAAQPQPQLKPLPEPLYPAREVIYDHPNPYATASLSAPGSIARSTQSLPASSRGTDSDSPRSSGEMNRPAYDGSQAQWQAQAQSFTSRRSSTSGGPRPPITLFVPPASSGWSTSSRAPSVASAGAPRPPITLFVPPASSGFATGPPVSGQQYGVPQRSTSDSGRRYVMPSQALGLQHDGPEREREKRMHEERDGDDEMARLREEEARRHVLIKREFVRR